MGNYVILTDSTADLPYDLIRRLGVRVEPLTYIIDGEEQFDEPTESAERIRSFYAELRAGKSSSTSQINESRFDEIFREILSEGRDVLYIAFSGALSATCSRAVTAAKELEGEFSDRRVVVVDSKCASLGEGLLVYYAAQMKNKGASMDEVADWLEQNKLHLCHWFTVDDLHHLKRGGRVSAAAAVIGSVLGIKPILHVDDEGRLILVSKTRGRRQSLDALVDRAEQTAVNPAEQTVFISHGDCIDDAEYVAEQLKRRLKVKETVINYIGPVIGSHSGPGTVAVFFMGTQR